MPAIKRANAHALGAGLLTHALALGRGGVDADAHFAEGDVLDLVVAIVVNVSRGGPGLPGDNDGGGGDLLATIVHRPRESGAGLRQGFVAPIASDGEEDEGQ